MSYYAELDYYVEPNISLFITYIPTILLLLLFIGSIFLQIFLSKKKTKWPGLILPTMFFIASIISIFTGGTGTEAFGWHLGVNIIYTILTGSIPTATMLIIYFVCRDKLRKRQNIEKMNIQDLD
ncbi:hypothetical protein SAMN02745823_03483 [Sporobacter termitidis DSM 10068]|uniref:Uncharacterized protein n=1 Tax=Sporobacter termitidis DSM 10068 TaxID=1123282 RepID=A0A1M5ZBB2_9FIRM|nr:hypothetical protein [Sporobacter termitidis]SHI21516.1 hypothetical protein SAMN02745823_03483 [Sporobacter termitidis DSM 10068]